MPVPKTATMVRKVARSQMASLSLTCTCDHSPAGSLPHKPTPPPSIEPSPCPVAGEDDTTPRGSPAKMDWSNGELDDPLPPLPSAIDFEVSTCSSQASIHVPGNEMVDDSAASPSPPDIVPQFIARIHDPESVAPPSLSASPDPAPKSHIEQVLALIVDCIGAIETKFGYMQDVIKGCEPNIPRAGVGLAHRPLAPPVNTTTTWAQPSIGPPVIHSARPPVIPSISPLPTTRVDDEIQDFPPLQGVSQKSRHRARVREAVVECNVSVPGAPAQGNNSYVLTRSCIAISFALVTMSANIHNHVKVSLSAQHTREMQKRNPSGKMKPGYSNVPLGFTDVVIIRNGGVDNETIEMSFCKQLPADIAQAAQRELNRLTANPPIVLRGKWSDTVQKTGNFVFCLAGNLSPEVIHSYGPLLCSHFPGTASVVPTWGWTWIQLRGVDVEYIEDNMGFTFDEEDLLKAFQANPCFANVVIAVPLYWQGNLLNFKKQTLTVITAILDEDNSLCQRTSRKGVCMFGRQVKFVRAGEHPSLIQCTQCHELGHNHSSPKCSMDRDSVQRYICGKGHDARDHLFKCPGTHKNPSICDCAPKCLLCKQSGHHVRDKKCMLQGDFAPPRLPRAAPVEARPPVEDALKEAAILVTRHVARPKGLGKEKGKATTPIAPAPPQELEVACKNSWGETHVLLCFCCLMMQFVDYQQACVGKEFTSANAPKTADDKDIIQLHLEFMVRKEKGEAFTHKAQKGFLEGFHG
jgi:hypothetical protein